MNLVFLGPPGAGKGTHAHMVCGRYKLAHLAAGDILRKNVKEGTPLGVEARAVMDRGELVSDGLVNHMMFEAICSLRGFEGFVLDGYPRTIGQAEALEKFLEESGKSLTAAVNFDASERIVIDRLSGRRGCPKCGKIYHLRNMPPKKEGICDLDGAALTVRKDDEPETIRKRLCVYHKSTKPLIEYYRNKKLLQDVPADGHAQAVQHDLEKLFEKINKPA